MPHPPIDVSLLERAITRLQEGLSRYKNNQQDDQLRDGLIQRFEFTYELSHKTLKRYLSNTAANPEAYHQMSFQDLIRSGNECGLLLSDWPQWRQFREMRAKTSHTYDEGTALDVVAGLADFIKEVEYLYHQILDRIQA